MIGFRKELKPNHKWFELETGMKIGAHEHSCLFCKNCKDLIYDYENGPYVFFCDKDSENKFTEASFEGKCPLFEEETA